MKIALFGGTFDPVHSGHLAAAQAAQEAFQLDRVLFTPTGKPPHKQDRCLTPFVHRYAMVTLACAGKKGFVPSLLEAGDSGEPNYSIETVRQLAAMLTPDDRLFFLVGADAFLHIRDWKEPVALLDSCDFIVVSRPGFATSQIAGAIPEGLLCGPQTENSVPLRHSSVNLLNTVKSGISSSAVRQLARQRKSLSGLVPASVQEYIRKLELFLDEQPND